MMDIFTNFQHFIYYCLFCAVLFDHVQIVSHSILLSFLLIFTIFIYKCLSIWISHSSLLKKYRTLIKSKSFTTSDPFHRKQLLINQLVTLCFRHSRKQQEKIKNKKPTTRLTLSPSTNWRRYHINIRIDKVIVRLDNGVWRWNALFLNSGG